MTKDELYKNLTLVDASRQRRQQQAQQILSHTELVKPLLEIVFNEDDTISYKAAWVLELVCLERLDLLYGYLNLFSKNISKLRMDSAIRPVAKICMLLLEVYYHKPSGELKDQLTQRHKERIMETCFTWMITEQKVATKAFSMSSLYLLGTEFKWVHPELKGLLERDYQSQTAGYKSKAKKILRLMSANNSKKSH